MFYIRKAKYATDDNKFMKILFRYKFQRALARNNKNPFFIDKKY